jgi:nucleolar protein 56
VSAKASKDPKFQLGVSEAKLGSEIQEATKIPCVCNEFVGEIVRGLRLHAPRFLKGLEEMDLRRSQLGLAHSYSRAKVGPASAAAHWACRAACLGCWK